MVIRVLFGDQSVLGYNEKLEDCGTSSASIRTLTQNFPRFHLAPPCPAKSMFLWETEDKSP